MPGANLVATVEAVVDDVWSCSSGPHAHEVAVPTGWNRVIAEYRQRPDGDPWDRLFVVQVNGVEVLRGTTPRTDFTVTKEWTRYASLLPQGGTATVTVDTSAWDACSYSQHVFLTLRFYDDPVVPDPSASAVANWGATAVCGKAKEARQVQFPATAPERATLEFFASNHGTEEAQFYGRFFSVRVDGVEVANFTVLPYTYAILGFYGGNDLQHPLMWWTAQRGLDVVGVHTGPGEIPPYRVTLSEAETALLTGARSVEVYASTGSCIWFASASFVLYDA
ncbi:MAG TPA: peptide-N4-asparagine amidase [Candidatus Thermoplasmatota archaeon]|nr:peptide-N4-asparagine amidase [Candidatus Thermoplasmatota archaeon]